MWLVRLALRLPYTFAVLALLILLWGGLAAKRMAKDIFPTIDIPVVSVVWTYNGLPAAEMERRIVTISERAMTTTVKDIEHMESQSYTGVAVIKVFFQPGTSVDAAVAQVTAISQTAIRTMPPGTVPPLIIRYGASDVPILQLGLGSKTMTEQQINDVGTNFLRVQLATVRGSSVPQPMGGKIRQIMVDIDPGALHAYGLTPADVSAAVNAQNLTLPSGVAKIGPTEYGVLLNGNADTVAALGDMPIRKVNGSMVYVRDVAQVRDGFAEQTNVVRQDGVRGALLPILKNGNASTLDVVHRVRELLPQFKKSLPAAFEVTPLFDQSVFVSAALEGVLREAGLATLLTALVILLFLGEWRNTLVVAFSIPLSIFASLACLSAFGQTINTMTLGGLALAVGILVDNATVMIENIDRNLAMQKSLESAILDGAHQIATPTLVATLCICVVFLPIFFLEGVAKYLFSPLALAVITSMVASYILSRTVVPTMVHFLLKGRPHGHGHGQAHAAGAFQRFHTAFNRGFDRFKDGYAGILDVCLRHRVIVTGTMAALAAATLFLLPYLGRDFFPSVDAGQIRLHVRAPAGTRIEETERAFTRVEGIIRQVIPGKEIQAITDNIGLANSATTLATTDSATVGTADGEILVSLDPGHHGPTDGYLAELRRRLNAEMPGFTFFTQPADITGQVLNFGLPAPIDIQFAGRGDPALNWELANELAGRLRGVTGAVDVHVHQVADAPALRVAVDRERAQEMGLTQRDVASSLLVSLSGSGQVAPNYWLSPRNGVQYPLVVQTPPRRLDSADALRATPLPSANKNPDAPDQLLGDLAGVARAVSPAVVSHYNIQPAFDVLVNVQGRDLGAVSDAIGRMLPEFRARMKGGDTLAMRGQVQSMDSSFSALGLGILGAVLLVYLLMVVNFQSWLDPLIIVTALPGAVCGILWTLFLTRTTLSVPALMGAIMSIGVGTANSILVVSFANEVRHQGLDAMAAAREAGATRLRPVLMTAGAMVIGMLPMALGLGDGGEQNAPLGRAVIGGLVLATLATLFLVPVVYSLLRVKPPVVRTLLHAEHPADPRSAPAASDDSHPSSIPLH